MSRFIQAAEPHASPIRPTAGIVPDYCVSISETVTFTAVWSKSQIVYATNFDGKFQTIAELKEHEIKMSCKENCLLSQECLLGEFPPGSTSRQRIAKSQLKFLVGLRGGLIVKYGVI